LSRDEELKVDVNISKFIMISLICHLLSNNV